jgi:hypothetical protein
MKKMIIPTTIFIVILALVISMAIIIPSKNIYEIQSSRIRDNIITSVQVQEKQATISVGKKSDMDRGYFSLTSEGVVGDNLYRRVLHKFSNYVLSETAGTNTYTYYLEETLEIIPVGEVNISTFQLDIFSRDGLYQMQWASVYLTGSKITRLQKNTVSSKAEFDAIDINAQTHTITTIATDNGYPVSNVILPTKYAIDTTLSTSKKIIIYYKTAYIHLLSNTPPASLPEEIPKDGFIWFTISFSYQPNYTEISFPQLTKTYGVDNKVISLSSNELMQNMTRQGNVVPVAQALTIPILADYAVGVETAIIKCSVQQYYDTDSVLCVSPYDSGVKSIFEVGDIVIPYRFGATGDTPISKYPNGDAKEYKVVGVNIIDDGAIWQKLTLQEMRQMLTENAVVFNSSASFYARFDYLRIYINSISVSREETYQTPITIYPRIGDILQLTAVGTYGVFDGVVSKFQKDGVDLVNGVDGFTIAGIGGRVGSLRFTYDLTKEGTYVAFIVAP